MADGFDRQIIPNANTSLSVLGQSPRLGAMGWLGKFLARYARPPKMSVIPTAGCRWKLWMSLDSSGSSESAHSARMLRARVDTK